MELEPQLLIVALFSRHAEALAWGRERLGKAYGPIALSSAVFPFDFTAYYEEDMGQGLQKQLLAFARLVTADSLADLKQQTVQMEQELAVTGQFPEARPLN